MTLKNSKSIFLLLWLLGPLWMMAQFPKLAVVSVVSNPMDTVFWNNNSPIVRYTVIIENVGSDQLQGNCELRLLYNQYPIEVTKNSWNAQNFEVGQTDTLQFNDTLQFLNVDRYKGGGNIIVIWPHTDNPAALAPDTASHEVYVTDMTGIRDPQAVEARVDIYPNPATDKLQIRYMDARHKLEGVRILGVDGRVCFTAGKAVEEIDLSALSAGLYFVEFKFKDGIYGAMRLLKE